MSSEVAGLLMGKGKVGYVPHLEMGDYVVVVNSEKVRVTGRKETQKVYFHHSGYPGGFKEVSFAKLKKEHPTRIIEHAVSGMLPDNRLKDKRLARLYLVTGSKNPYENKFKEK